MESTRDTVLITGITGYIGSWVGKEILDNSEGRFKIKATVRDLKNQNKLEPLKQAYGEELFNQIEFLEADLTSSESLTKAVEGVQYIVHVASPIPGQTTYTEDEMVGPAIQGMKTLIEASVKNRVKKIIVTSSLATILGGAWKKGSGDNHYTEQDIAPKETADAYSRSKIAQEQVIREFLAEQEKSQSEYNLEIVTLHPTFVIGPTIITERNSSPEGIAKIMKRDIPGLPALCLPSVDVRDVAKGHYQALVTPGLSGKRIILNKESLWMTGISEILDQEFKQYGYRVTTRRIGFCPLKIASWFDQQVRMLLPLVNLEITADNKLSKELLGLEYKMEMKQSVIEMGYSLIEKGLVPDRRNLKK